MESHKRPRVAVLVGNQTFSDTSGLSALKFPSADVADVACLLSQPGIGGYDRIETLVDLDSYSIMDFIAGILSDEVGADLLFYYSGHGIPSDGGKLYLAAKNTQLNRLYSRAIPFHNILEMVSDHGVRRFAAILDCCFAGLAVEGLRSPVEHQVRALAEQHLQLHNDGKGLYFLGATSSTTSAKEIESLGHGALTAAIIEGLRSGLADIDGDGRVTGPNLFEWCKQYARSNGVHPPVQCTNVVNDDIIIAFGKNNEDQSSQIEVYNSHYEPNPYSSWQRFQSEGFPGFNTRQKITLEILNRKKACILETATALPMGMNLNIEHSSGRILFSFIVFEQTDENVSFSVIPMRYGNRLASNRRGGGTEIYAEASEPRARSLRILFRSRVAVGRWQEAELQFDFSNLGGDVFAVFAPRINENGRSSGPGRMAFANVKVFVDGT